MSDRQVTTDINLALEALRAGQLVAIPTETVYGLGADARNDEAVRKIFAAKGRPADHPLIVHIGDAAQMKDWALTVSPAAQLLADALWPGPLTLLLQRHASVSDVVTGGRPTIGLRVPDHSLTLALLVAFGGGVAAPSANRFGKVSPTTAAHVVADLGEAVDLVLDGGPCRVGVESTIVDLGGEVPEVLRLGGISLDQIAEVLGEMPRVRVAAEPSDRGAKAPGMLESHYAPDAKIIVVDESAAIETLIDALANADGPVGLLSPAAMICLPEGIVELEPAGIASEYASVLYSRLRQADRLGITTLVVIPPSSVGIGAAVCDRLQRAASNR